MLLVIKRNLYVLDLAQSVDSVCDSCHTCASLTTFSDNYIEQSSEPTPDVTGINFAADVFKQNHQLILILRETVIACTAACLITNEKVHTLKEALLLLYTDLHQFNGPRAIISADPVQVLWPYAKTNS